MIPARIFGVSGQEKERNNRCFEGIFSPSSILKARVLTSSEAGAIFPSCNYPEILWTLLAPQL